MHWSRNNPRRARVVAAAVVFVAALAVLQVCVFGPAFRLPFVFDDYNYLNRVQVSGWLGPSSAWDLRSQLFRPILYVFFGSLHAVFGLRPFVFHVAGAGLVLAAAGMTGLVAHRLGLRMGAIAAATVYALHSSMATPIGWASAANSPLAVALALGSVYLLLAKRVRVLGVVASCILFVLALMTREVVVVVPMMLLVALALSEAGGWRTRARRALVGSAPLWGVLVVYVVARRIAGYELSTTGSYAQHLGTQAFSNLGRLLELVTDIAPARDGVHRPVPVTLLWLLLVGAAVLLRRSRPQVGIGVVWFLLGTLPVIFLRDHPMSFYYVDLAMVGVALAVGAVFERIAVALTRRRRAAFAVGCLAIFVVVSHHTAQQQLEEKLYAFADITTGFVRSLERDNPRPRPGGSVVVWYRDSDPIFMTARGDLLRVRYHDPGLQVSQLEASGTVAKLVRIGDAHWIGVVAPPAHPTAAGGATPCPTPPTRACVTQAVASILPTAKDPARPAPVPARVDRFDTTVMGVSAQRLFVVIGIACFGYLALSFLAELRRRSHRTDRPGAAGSAPPS